MSDMPAPGDLAPSFTGATATGDTIDLDSYRGQWVALYFYPKQGPTTASRWR
ncbi:MAG: redoxin domain-containing protein [Bacteroidota bacterium]